MKKKTGSRRALAQAVRLLQAQASQFQAILTAAAIANGGTLLIEDEHLDAIDEATEMAVERVGSGVRVVTRNVVLKARGYSLISGPGIDEVRVIEEAPHAD